jgi:hypothetical protein
MKRFVRFVAAVALVTGCSDSFSPSIDTVSGIYTAGRLETVSGGITTNQLAGGATLTLQLAANRTTTGRLFLPGGGDGGGDIDESLAGTWTLAGSSVDLTEAADTFLRDIVLTASEGQLIGELTSAGTTIRVTLEK